MQDDYRENPFSDDEETIAEAETTQENSETAEEKQKKNSISADLIRGHINTIILRSLYEGDRYGYDIISEIEQKSHGQYTLKQPTLYSALKRLETQGYVKAYWGGTSGGGRRRYFSLTDEGREVAERNQAEWEYSRTIIDSLISQNDFDFSNPAPEKLDFRILRKATSRTPIVNEMEEDESSAPFMNTSQSNGSGLFEQKIEPEQPLTPAPVQAEPIQAATSTVTESIAPAVSETPLKVSQAPVAAETQEPVQERQASAIQQPRGRSIPLFLTRTEEERNYKDILSRIYQSGIKQEPPIVPEPVAEPKETIQTPPPAYTESSVAEPIAYTQETITENPLDVREESVIKESQVRYNEPKPEPKAAILPGRIDFQDIKEQASYDGLRVWTAGGASAKKEIPENFFNKGVALLCSGLVFFFVAIIETIFTFISAEAWNIDLRYQIIMLICTCIPPVVCTVLYFLKRKTYCKRLKNNSSLYNGIIAFISAFILLVAIALLMNVNLMDGMTAIKFIVIPCIYLLNIIVFSATYYFYTKSKV